MELAKELDGRLLDRDGVVEKYKKLVHSIANKFRKRAAVLGLEYEDLVSEGFIGLLKAFEKWDPNKFEKVTRFSTYAVPNVKGAMLRLFRDTNTGAKFSRSVKETAYQIKKQDLFQSSPEEIAEQLNQTLERVKLAITYLHSGTRSMNEVISSDDKDLTLEETLGKEQDFSNLFVSEFLDSLPDKERDICEMLLKQKSQSEIGEVIGCSQVSVSRIIERKIRPKIKSFFGKGDEVEMKGSMEVTKENCVKLLSEGKKSREIAEIFGLSKQRIDQLKSELGLTKKKGSPLKIGKETSSEVPQPVLEIPTKSDYSKELEKYQMEIDGLTYSNKLLTDQLKEKGDAETINREMYQENAELKQFLKEKENVILGLFEDYKALERKYESLVTYTKEIM
jgi:RNA polymerase sigma factor (sigma-70 family)